MYFKKKMLLVLFLMNCLLSVAQTETTLSTKDLSALLGKWEGTITYLDYTTNKPFTMAAGVEIQQIRESNSFVFKNTYPQEPKANDNDTITLSTNGRLLNEKVIRSKRALPNSGLEIITEYLATDGNDNKPAIIKNTYTINKDNYVNRKDVQFVLGGAWIKRSEYAYRKKVD